MSCLCTEQRAITSHKNQSLDEINRLNSFGLETCRQRHLKTMKTKSLIPHNQSGRKRFSKNQQEKEYYTWSKLNYFVARKSIVA